MEILHRKFLSISILFSCILLMFLLFANTGLIQAAPVPSPATDTAAKTAAAKVSSPQLEEARRQLQAAEQSNNQEGIATAYNQIAFALIQLMEHGEARQYLEKAYTMANENNWPKVKALVQDSFSIMYLYQGLYDLALQSALEALDSFQKLNDPINSSKVYTNLGRIEFNMQHYDDAIDHYEKSLALKGENDVSGIAMTMIHYASALHAKGEVAKARQKAEAALEIGQKNRLERPIAWGHLVLGKIALSEENPFLAKKLFLIATERCQKFGDFNSTIFSLSGAAQASLLLYETEEAKAFYLQALDIAHKSRKLADASDIQQSLADIAEKEGDLTAALSYTKASLRDYREAQIALVAQATVALESRYEFSVKQKEVELLKKENVLQRLEASRAQLIATFLGLGLSSLLLLSLILWQQIRTKRRKEKELQQITHQLEDVNMQLSYLADTDALTRMPNRRKFTVEYESLFISARRSGQPFGVILADVDYFKEYNDTYGHIAGDHCLRQIAALLLDYCTPPCLTARYGGEEFAFMILGDPATVVQRICTLKTGIEKLNITHKKSVFQHITVSFGIAHIYDHEEALPETLLQQADRELYYAKANGRNAVSYRQSLQD